MISDKWLQRYKELCEQANPAPWRLDDFQVTIYKFDGSCHSFRTDRNDAKFITESRSAMPELIEEVEKLRSALDKIYHSTITDSHENSIYVFEIAKKVLEKNTR